MNLILLLLYHKIENLQGDTGKMPGKKQTQKTLYKCAQMWYHISNYKISQGEITMELKNKVINFLGDSITEGVGASSV